MYTKSDTTKVVVKSVLYLLEVERREETKVTARCQVAKKQERSLFSDSIGNIRD